MASTIPRILRPYAAVRAIARRNGALRPFSIATAPLRASVGNVPPPPLVPESERREMAVGELEGADFKIEPLRRVGEDEKTMRARLTYQSRKRGILESDLLLSTFADEYLPHMTKEQMVIYDLFLDENDWDIYYWATQDAPESSSTATQTADTSSASYAGGAEAEAAIAAAHTQEAAATGGVPRSGDSADVKDLPQDSISSEAAAAEPYNTSRAGEWAQTVGTFKPAYRPVPARWRDSDILRQLRDHVQARRTTGKGGMAFMPPLRP